MKELRIEVTDEIYEKLKEGKKVRLVVNYKNHDIYLTSQYSNYFKGVIEE